MGATDEIKEAKLHISNGKVLLFSSLDDSNKLPLDALEDAYVYTAGLHALGVPEIVILLGPKERDQAIPKEATLGLVVDALTRFNKQQLMAMSTKNVDFVSIGVENRIRYYKKVIFDRRDSDDRHRYLSIKEKHLKKLNKILKTDSFEYVLYEPMTWAN